MKSFSKSRINMLRAYLRSPGPFPINFVWMTVVMMVFGLALIFQESRWSNTPAYANLLQISNSHVWGAIYLTIGIVMISALLQLHRRWLLVFAHTAAIALIGAWFVAFVVRWLTDDGTTIVNVVSWLTYLFMLIRSATVIDNVFNRRAYERR